MEKPLITTSTPSSLFCLFLYVVIFTNFDTGVIPASLSHLQRDLSLSRVSVAALGTLPYFGICVASLGTSGIIRRINAKRALWLSLLGNAGFCALFSFSSNLWILYFSRFLKINSEGFILDEEFCFSAKPYKHFLLSFLFLFFFFSLIFKSCFVFVIFLR